MSFRIGTNRLPASRLVKSSPSGKGGLVFYGGLIGATLAGVLYARLKKLPLWKMADILAPSIALGYVFGRIGCLLNGCCYGRACGLPWAIRFPAGNPLNPPTTRSIRRRSMIRC